MLYVWVGALSTRAKGTCRGQKPALSTQTAWVTLWCWEPSPRPSSVGVTSAPTADPVLRSLLFTFSDDMQESDVSLFFYSWALKSNERKKNIKPRSVCAAKHRRSRCAELDLWERIRQNESPDAEVSLQTSVPDKRHWCVTVLRPSKVSRLDYRLRWRNPKTPNFLWVQREILNGRAAGGLQGCFNSKLHCAPLSSKGRPAGRVSQDDESDCMGNDAWLKVSKYPERVYSRLSRCSGGWNICQRDTSY